MKTYSDGTVIRGAHERVISERMKFYREQRRRLRVAYVMNQNNEGMKNDGRKFLNRMVKAAWKMRST